MKNKLVVMLIMIAVGFLGYTVTYAFGGGVGNGEVQGSEGSSIAIEIGNKVCPVMGGKIAEKTAIKISHEGKIYNLCCSGCRSEFRNNPEKYIEKIKESVQDNLEEDYCVEVQSCNG